MFNKKKKNIADYEVMCDGWLFVTVDGTLSNMHRKAVKFTTEEEAVKVARLFSRNEKFTIIERKDGRLKYTKLTEMTIVLPVVVLIGLFKVQKNNIKCSCGSTNIKTTTTDGGDTIVFCTSCSNVLNMYKYKEEGQVGSF